MTAATATMQLDALVLSPPLLPYAGSAAPLTLRKGCMVASSSHSPALSSSRTPPSLTKEQARDSSKGLAWGGTLPRWRATSISWVS